jgi:hypothetical protein
MTGGVEDEEPHPRCAQARAHSDGDRRADRPHTSVPRPAARGLYGRVHGEHGSAAPRRGATRVIT